MSKYLFLDIDGVLNVIPQGRDEFGSKFHQHFEYNLAWIIRETGCKIVISSSWRHSGLNEMQRMWEQRSLPGEVVDITPNLTYGSGKITSMPRGMEIKAWLDENYHDAYAILDDDNDMLEEQLSHFVCTSGNNHHADCIDAGYGLTKECAQKVIEILNKTI